MNAFIFMFAYILIMSYFAKTMSPSIRMIDGERTQTNISRGWAITIIFIPIVMIGLRSEYGDTAAYIGTFNKLSTSFAEIVNSMEDSKGVGWLLYEWFVKSYITQNSNFFLLITATLNAIGVIKLYRKYSEDYGLSMLLFFMSCSFLNMMNGIRQFTAVTLIVFFSDWLFEKKYIRFIFIVLIASTIHISAIIWVPIMFAVQGKPWHFRTIATVAATILVLVYLNQFTSLLEDTLAGSLYEGYTEQFLVDDGANIIHAIIAAMPVFLSLLGRRQLNYKEDHVIDVLINISIINVLINVIAHFTSGILIGRLPMYFNLFNFALYPSLLNRIFEDRSKLIIKLSVLIGYFVYALYYFKSMGAVYVSSILHL